MLETRVSPFGSSMTGLTIAWVASPKRFLERFEEGSSLLLHPGEEAKC